MNDPRDLPEEEAAAPAATAPAPTTEAPEAAPAVEAPATAAADEGPAPAPSSDTPPAVATLSPAACAARLAELFPAVFAPGAAKPLKLRIQADVQQRAPGVFTKKALSIFLQRHTTSTAYLKALAQAAERIDLDGQPAGPVSDEHREAAAAELQRRRALHDERRAAEREAQRKAQDEARRQREGEAKAIHERAGLLRAYETSTLTRANFCALKGLTESELEAALAQARQDRERRPQAPPPQPRAEAPPGERERRMPAAPRRQSERRPRAAPGGKPPSR